MIKVENLSKSFGSAKVLCNVSVEINKGECIAIIGPSGAGKSMFLYCLNALQSHEGGTITIAGENISDKKTDINKVRQKMGMVYQNFNLFSHLTVLENIVLALVKVKKMPRGKAEAKAQELLEMVSLVEKKHSYPDELSGGQKQRIAIVRAIAMDPQIVLFDEPTSALDPTMVGEVLAVIRSLAKQGFTMVIVTHEMNFAKEIAHRVLYMDEKGIYESGTPDEIFNHPQKPKTIAFINKLKTFNYNVNSLNFDLIAMCAQLELFCGKYNIEREKVNNVNLALEELITYILRNCYDRTQTPNIDIMVEYSDSDKKIRIELSHNGRPVNPFENISFTAESSGGDTDDLGIFMVKQLAEDISFASEGGCSKFEVTI